MGDRWSKSVRDIYDEAVRRLGGDPAPLHWGPAHVVWEDDNFDFVAECIAEFDNHKFDFSTEQLAVVRWSLEELAKLPESDLEMNWDDGLER